MRTSIISTGMALASISTVWPDGRPWPVVDVAVAKSIGSLIRASAAKSVTRTLALAAVAILLQAESNTASDGCLGSDGVH